MYYLQLKDRIKRYKFEVRRIKRRRQYLIRDRLAHSFIKRKKDSFWLDVKSIKSPRFSPVVDGANGDTNIANAFSSKFSAVLNKHSTSSSQTIPSATIQSSLTESHLSAITVSYDQITEAISLLKSRKSDAYGVTSEHLKYASPVIANVLSSFLLQFCGMVTCHYVLEILFWYLFLRVTKMPLIAPTFVQLLFRPRLVRLLRD